MTRYDLEGKTVIVTGGIGAASARQLVRKGAEVTLVDLSADAVGDLAAQLPVGSALPFVADVTDVDQMTAAVEATVSEFGPPRRDRRQRRHRQRSAGHARHR
ncbi:SDR family NAD(P)-dependent oxidoreductase [Streptomyces sp. NPDC005046]